MHKGILLGFLLLMGMSRVGEVEHEMQYIVFEWVYIS